MASENPILENISDILNGIFNHKVSYIGGPTGVGKTVNLPVLVARKGFLLSKQHGSYEPADPPSGNPLRIIVSIPTITAVRDVYNQAKAKYPEFAKHIGFAAESRVEYDDSHDVVYATSGHVYRHMIRKFRRKGKRQQIFDPLDFPVIAVDEIHTGTVENSIILGLWTHMYRSLPEDLVPRLLMITATKIFDILEYPRERIFDYDIPVPEGRFTKTIKYLTPNEYSEWSFGFNLKNSRGNNTGIVGFLAEKIADVHQANRYVSGQKYGHMLVFLAGSMEVNKLAEILEKNLDDKVRVLKIYSSMDVEDRERIYGKVPNNVRKIIIGTNIVESAVTIPDIKFVFDSMREKRPETSSTGGIRLLNTFISRKSAEQRAGRTGRTMNGYVYRLMPEDYFNSKRINDERPLDIYRVPIVNPVLEMIRVKLDPYLILEKAGRAKIRKTMKELDFLRMIEMRENEKNGKTVLKVKILPSGKFATRIPLGIRAATFLWRWLNPQPKDRDLREYADAGVLVACIIDSDPSTLFDQAYQERDETDEEFRERQREVEKIHLRFVGLDDLTTVINLVNTCQQETDISLLEPRQPEQTKILKKWCYNNYIQSKGMTDMARNMVMSSSRVSHFLRRQGMRFRIRQHDSIKLSQYSRVLLEDINRDRILQKQGANKYIRNISQEMAGFVRGETSYFAFGNTSIPRLSPINYETIIGIVLTETKFSASKVTGYIGMYIVSQSEKNNFGTKYNQITMYDLDVDYAGFKVPKVLLPGLLLGVKEKVVIPRQSDSLGFLSRLEISENPAKTSSFLDNGYVVPTRTKIVRPLPVERILEIRKEKELKPKPAPQVEIAKNDQELSETNSGDSPDDE